MLCFESFKKMREKRREEPAALRPLASSAPLSFLLSYLPLDAEILHPIPPLNVSSNQPPNCFETRFKTSASRFIVGPKTTDKSFQLLNE